MRVTKKTQLFISGLQMRKETYELSDLVNITQLLVAEIKFDPRSVEFKHLPLLQDFRVLGREQTL